MAKLWRKKWIGKVGIIGHSPKSRIYKHGETRFTGVFKVNATLALNFGIKIRYQWRLSLPQDHYHLTA